MDIVADISSLDYVSTGNQFLAGLKKVPIIGANITQMKYLGGMPERPNGADSKSVGGVAPRGFESLSLRQ